MERTGTFLCYLQSGKNQVDIYRQNIYLGCARYHLYLLLALFIEELHIRLIYEKVVLLLRHFIKSTTKPFARKSMGLQVFATKVKIAIFDYFEEKKTINFHLCRFLENVRDTCRVYAAYLYCRFCSQRFEN